MTRRGHGTTNLSVEDAWAGYNGLRPGPVRRRKERLDAYDTTPAKTVLAVVGVAVAIVLIWLESKGY